MIWHKIIPKQKEADKFRNKFDHLEIADFYIYCANIIKTFVEGYGYKKSVETSLPVNQKGDPVPLYTYPAIEYLNSLDFKGKEIFEFGSGNSTLFWLNKGAIVTSVEHNEIWFEDLKEKTSQNNDHEFIFAKGEEYVSSVLRDNKQYDIIVIDGTANRLQCARNAIKSIKKDGVIIVDNADWFENTTKLIRDELDFIQIDFYGFKPCKYNTSATSIFLSRRSNLRATNKKQPSYCIGGIDRHSQNDIDKS
jgi:hypothetical protein